jgi:predicted PurR-regulated permease PerM
MDRVVAMTIILGEPRDEASVIGVNPNAQSSDSPWKSVPWRTIVAAIGILSVLGLLLVVIIATLKVVLWVLIAGFLAMVLAPTVRRVEKLVRGHRGIATAIVMFTAAALVLSMVALFVAPLRSQLVSAITDLPGTVETASRGTGPLGRIVTRLNLANLVADNKVQLREWAKQMDDSSFSIARSAFEGLLAFLTIFVIAFLLLTQSSTLGRVLLTAIPHRRKATAQKVAVDAAAAVSGYMMGNFLISLVAGSTSFVCLLLLGVPNAAVFALWVAFADLIPLVGATLGAAPSVLAAFLHSTKAGVLALIFFVVYQQFENSVLQTAVMSRTVKVNPLVVLLSVLIGVELFGFAGAIFAIPLAGSLQVLGKEIAGESRRNRLVLPD